VACLVAAAALWVRVARWEWAALIFSIGFVFCAEVLNTAVELTIDMIKATEHPIARIVKDVAASAVLVAVAVAVGIGWLVFHPYLVHPT